VTTPPLLLSALLPAALLCPPLLIPPTHSLLLPSSIEFGDEDDSQATIADPTMCAKAAECLGCDDLETALLKATLKVSRSESYTIELDPLKAAAGRDAFTKAVYQRLFDLLVTRVNTSLADADEAGHAFIGLLDVFGFEIFEVNSFEQLCINYTNERLQNFFLKAVFQAEEMAYKEDGIRWEPIQYTVRPETPARPCQLRLLAVCPGRSVPDARFRAFRTTLRSSTSATARRRASTRSSTRRARRQRRRTRRSRRSCSRATRAPRS